MSTIAEATPSQIQWHQQRAARLARLGVERPRAIRRIAPPPSPPEEPKRPSIPVATGSAKAILGDVCRRHGVTRDELIGQSRFKRIMSARHEAAFRLIVEGELSYAQAGRRLGGRDHTTMINSINMHLARHPEDRPAYEAWRAARAAHREAVDELAMRLLREGKSVNFVRDSLGLSYHRLRRVLADMSTGYPHNSHYPPGRQAGDGA